MRAKKSESGSNASILTLTPIFRAHIQFISAARDLEQGCNEGINSRCRICNADGSPCNESSQGTSAGGGPSRSGLFAAGNPECFVDQSGLFGDESEVFRELSKLGG